MVHTVLVASTWAQLVDPHGTSLLFWAGRVLLWLVRDEDRFWSLGIRAR